jgi:DNA-binding response OmpR family regulator
MNAPPETAPRLLVVEDDASVAATLVRGLRAARFEVELATDGQLGLDAIQRERFDGVVLDLGLPRLAGAELLRILSARDVVTVVLTAAGDLPTRLACFADGAADFLPKPFFMEELVARVRARLRVEAERERVSFGDVELFLAERRVSRAGKAVPLTRNELDVLVYLARRPGRAISRAALAQHALSAHEAPSERTIDSHVAHLRSKLGASGRAIETVWGIGYRFMATPAP